VLIIAPGSVMYILPLAALGAYFAWRFYGQ
jgi:hypothetical protein